MSYCTLEDIRTEGFTEEDYPDEVAERLIKLSSEYIDRVTGQFFEPREMAVRLDGRGGKNLVLPLFLIDCDYVKVKDELIEDYVLYNRITPVDDRPYPKIYRNAGWPEGIMNVEISGTWGYVEAGNLTPESIKRAAMKLAMYNFPLLSDSEAQGEKSMKGLLLSETTDGHSYELSEEVLASLASGAITGDSEIDQILRGYTRSKFRMAVV